MKRDKKSYHHGNLREAALEQAGILLERDGLRNVSVREISRVLDVSHTAPRRHFPTKQRLLDALAIYGYEQLGSALSRALKDHDAQFEIRLIRATGILVDFALENPALLATCLPPSTSPTRARNSLQRAASHSCREFSSWLKDN